MSKPSHIWHRADANHYTIQNGLKCAGVLVEDMHNGKLFDLIAVYGGQIYLFEIKAPGKSKDLTPLQEYKRILWGKYIHIIETTFDAFKIMGMA